MHKEDTHTYKQHNKVTDSAQIVQKQLVGRGPYRRSNRGPHGVYGVRGEGTLLGPTVERGGVGEGQRG